MGVESEAHHGESISPAVQQPQTSSQESVAYEKPRDVGVDTPVPRVTLRAFVMGLFVSMGGLLFGYDTGQISGFQEMSDYLERYGELQPDGSYSLSKVRSGLLVSLLSVGTLIGALVGAPVADKLGRKWSITVWCVIMIIGLIVQITSPSGHWYQMVVGRWVTGLGVGGCSLLVPMYQGESAPRHIRGAMISCYQLFVTLGIFLSYCINLGTESLDGSAQWRITLGLTFLFALVLGGGMAVFPESPRFEFRHGRVDSARRTMSKLYGVPENHRVIIQEIEEIQQQLDAESEQQVWHEFLTAPRMFYRIVLGMVLQSLQQLTGANYFFYYGTTIFQGAGISNSFITQVILGAINFGTTFGGLYVVENFGRRKSLIFGAGFMFVCFMIFASIGHFLLDVNNPENTPGPGKGMIVVACFFITAYAMTWGPMIWAIAAELFPSKYRAKGMALATASNWLWNFLIGFFTPFITGDIDFAYGYVFAGCLFAAALVVYFCVIEGKGRTLEELDWMYVNKVKPWESSKFQMPDLHSGERREARKESQSFLDRPLRDGKYADEWKRSNPEEVSSNLQKWYNAGRLLFPRESLQSIRDQITKPPKKGELIYVKGFDETVYEYRVMTGDRRMSYQPLFENEEDGVCYSVENCERVEFVFSIESLQSARDWNVAQSYLSLRIGHWMTRVGEQEPQGDLAASLDLAAWRQIQTTLRSLPLTCQITKVIGIACGCFAITSSDPKGYTRSAVQHAFLLAMRKAWQENGMAGDHVACNVQDPAYTSTDRQILQKQGIQVVEDPEGFLQMDEASVVFSCAPNICVKQIVADIARPAVLVWCVVEEDDSEYTSTDPNSPRVMEMVENEYDEFPFPDDKNFTKMRIYARKDQKSGRVHPR
ncbi:hypothetical protein BJX96DRAFT_163863 [Aspergillus floccosus]